MWMTHEELLSHQAFVRDLARRLLADDATADDVAQDAMVAAVVRPPRTGSNVRAWLATVVRNLVRRGARTERRRDARERAAARPEAMPKDDDAIERLSWHRRVVDAVLSLEEPYRRTVAPRHYESMPPREVARQMGVPVATVRTLLVTGPPLRNPVPGFCGLSCALCLCASVVIPCVVLPKPRRP